MSLVVVCSFDKLESTRRYWLQKPNKSALCAC